MHRTDQTMYVTNPQGQPVKCGKSMQSIFEPGSGNQPGIDAAVIQFEGGQMMDILDIAIDSRGQHLTFAQLGMFENI